MGVCTAIVTGANKGIGKETARELAEAGLRVILACRNAQAAEQAKAEIIQETGNKEVHVISLDISSRKSIQDFVEQFKEQFGTLNVLVNNAGISNTRDKKTSDGLEPIIGTNFFGTFMLTQRLLLLFEKGAECRIIVVVSNIYTMGRFSFDRIGAYRWVKAYSVSKYLLLLYVLELAKRNKESGIEVFAVHPGIVRTTIMFTNKWYDAIIRVILSPFFIDPVEGCRTSVYLALSESVRGQGGSLFAKSKRIEIPARFRDFELAEKVWDLGMEYLNRQ